MNSIKGDPESGIRNVPILLVGTKQNEVPIRVVKIINI